MRKVQTTCPQCGAQDGYLEPEEGDYAGGITWIQQPWECSRCGYPRVTWTKWGRTYQNTTSVTINSLHSKEKGER